MSASERALTILLVEDDDVDIMNVQRALLRNGLATPVRVAHNGLEALAALRDGTLAEGNRVVLLDLNMPKMNGIEFLRELRADPSIASTTVVVLTTSNDDRDKVEAYRLHVAGYLLKPVTFAHFVDMIATLNKYWSLVEMP